MTTRYLIVRPIQEPYEYPADPDRRPAVQFNVQVLRGYSATFLEEVLSILTVAGVGVANETIFLSSQSSFPKDNTTTFCVVKEYTGGGGQRIQNQTAPAYSEPNAQLTFRGPTYQSARAMAWAAWTALANVKNQDVTTA
jgi:hypothetical protein